MKSVIRRRASLPAAALLFIACAERTPPEQSIALACDSDQTRALVETFGNRLQDVPLLAPDSVIRSALRQNFAPLVTPELLESWLADPSSAPGREVSSPWPERIEIRSVRPLDRSDCLFTGDVLYVTSTEVTGRGIPLRVPAELIVHYSGEWRIREYQSASPFRAEPPPALLDPANGAPEPATSSEQGEHSGSPRPARQEPATDSIFAADGGALPEREPGADVAIGVISEYYGAIEARDFRRAYALWSGEGAASGQSYADFAAGFADTREVKVTTGTPSRIEPAAGSRFIEIPVEVRAVLRSGTRQHFTGSYTLRRTVVTGASAAERSWRIESASLHLAP